MKLSEKRQMAIYTAVHDRMMTLRIELAKMPGLQSTKLGEEVDRRVELACRHAASAAVKAAEGKP